MSSFKLENPKESSQKFLRNISEMFIISNKWGNTNQNDFVISSSKWEWQRSSKQPTANGVDSGRKGPSLTFGDIANC